MRSLAGLLLVLFVSLAACSSQSAPESVPAVTPSTAAVATTPSTTTSAPTTTTTAPTTTTTTLPAFEPRKPTERENASYLLLAAISLKDTPYSLAEMSTSDGAAMLHDGGVGVCRALFAGETLAQALFDGLQETPAAGIPADQLSSDEFSLAMPIGTSGIKNYCPDLDPGVNGEDTSAGALLLTNAWQELTGGEAIDEDTIIMDGTWEVGTDVQPGTYRNSGSASGCYWERLSGFGGTPADLIANGLSEDQQIVTILDTDAGFKSEDCGTWFRTG